MTMTWRKLASLALPLLGYCTIVTADPKVYELAIRDHRFEPAEIEVPAATKVKLIVRNLDPTPEEFESYELRREKVVPGNGQVVIWVGPLKPGEYPFFGEFNQATAQGRLVAR